MRSLVVRLLCMAAVSLLAGCTGGGGVGSLIPLPGFGGNGVAYDVSIEGDIPAELRGKLQDASQLVTLRSEKPTSRAALRRRVDGDVATLGSVLRAEGYYGGAVVAKTDLESDPAKVVLQVKPGKRYDITSYDISYDGNFPGIDSLPSDPGKFGYTKGMPARGATVVAIEQALVDYLHRNGRPKADVANRKAVVDYDTHSMKVTLHVDPGPPAVFGALDLEGLKKVKEDYIRFLLDWPKGKQWNAQELDDIRRKLVDTNLFRTVHVQAADTVNADGQLPVTVTVEESKHRTVAVGVNYSTDEGPGGELSWEHRNLFGRQERLRLSAQGSAVRQQATADFRKPHFYLRDLSLLANVTARAQETDAYDERTGAAFAGLDKKLAEIWTLGIGVSGEYSRITQNGNRSLYAIAGVPIHVSRDSTDNLLNPTEGTRLKLSTTPYLAMIEQNVTFAEFDTEASAYYGLGKEKRVVPAVRVRAGTIIGANIFDIPATKRFYAGGGGSVRGYGYQMVGPLDAAGDPTGGLSRIDLSVELRWRITEHFGIVPFIDGGNVYDSAVPDLSQRLFWGAGLGFRYYTIAGPIRLDIAYPLNRRRGIDSGYQIYVSLGQSF